MSINETKWLTWFWFNNIITNFHCLVTTIIKYKKIQNYRYEDTKLSI